MQPTDLPLWLQAGFAVIRPSEKKGVLQNYHEIIKGIVYYAMQGVVLCFFKSHFMEFLRKDAMGGSAT